MMKKFTGIIALVLCFINSHAQQQFDSLLNIANEQYPQEKIYLQLDRPYYNTGETIWFKAYITGVSSPLVNSKTMYAELINDNGTVLQRKTMPVLQAGAASFFELADSVYNSKLFIRAYTLWMTNFDSSLLYLKPVTVINAKPAAKKAPVAKKFTLTLFPEGGDLVDNISAVVAFKTNDQDGIPFPVSGTITDSKGKPVTKFTAVHDGMGFFTITPVPGEKYKAIWKDKTGAAHETALPDAKPTGITLHVTNKSGELTYTITRPEAADDVFKSYFVMAQMHEQTMYGAKINMQRKTQVTAPIVTDSMPDGILQLTVFNAAQVPVAERLVFINNNNYYFATDLHAVEKNMSPHGKTVLQIDVGGNYLSNLSIAVTDAGFDAVGDNKDNIFSELMLSSDLKGYVYNSSYYFSSEEDSVKEHLDLVMMTNGWRRFKWEDMLTNKWPALKSLPDNYLAINGSIYGLSKVQLRNRSITGILKTPGSNASSFFNMPVTDDGKFRTDGFYFFDTVQFHYQINNDKEKILTSTASFAFDNGLVKAGPAFNSLLASIYGSAKPDSSLLLKGIQQSGLYKSQIDMQKSKLLQAVVVTSKQKPLSEKLDEQYASGLFKSGDAKIFATDDDPFAKSAMSILDYLRGKVAGLQINTTGGQPTITRRGSNTSLFLNEMSADIDQLQSTPMSDVAMIKVFDPPFFGATGGGAGGAVAVYTKRGAANNANIKGLNSVILNGYSALKQFYMPDYDKTNGVDVKDYRTTLYWNPFLLMDAKKRRITIPVFNSDNCKKMRVIIEGINENGQLTREEKVFE